MGRSAGRRLRALDALARQAQAILEHYPNADEAARVVGINPSTLYNARRGVNTVNTSSMRKIEEAFQVIQSEKRADDEAHRNGREAVPSVVSPPRLVDPYPVVEAVRARLQAARDVAPQTTVAAPFTEEIEMRTCEVCERSKPLAEGYYWKDGNGYDGYEKLCRSCSSRLRDRVQKALTKRQKEWDAERVVITRDYERLAQDFAARLAAAEEAERIAQAVTIQPVNPGEVAVVKIAVGQVVEHLLDLATEVEQVQRLVAGLSDG